MRREVLPSDLARELCMRCRLPRQRDANDIIRAIAFRVCREEWPAIADAGQHAAWVLRVGVRVLLREGQITVLLERAQVSEMLAASAVLV